MLTFRQFLLMEKNLHQLHLEQYALRGLYPLRKAIEILQDMRAKLYGNSNYKADGNLSLKYDGAPAAVFGINPENGRFFVATKSAFNKTPKLAYSMREVGTLYEGGPVNKLKILYKHLHPVIKEGIYQGDFLWDGNSLAKNEIDEQAYYTFRPNTITYAVKTNSDLGKRIAKSSCGIVIHTKYKGDTIHNLATIPGVVDLSDKSTNRLVILSPKINDITGVINFTAEENKKFTELISRTVKEFSNLDNIFFAEFEENALSLFEKYINSKIRQNQFVTNNFFNEFKQFVVDNQGKGLAWIEENKDRIISLTQIYSDLAQAKNIIVDKLNEIDTDIETFIKTDKGFQATDHEGFCAVQDDGEIIKFVDRLEFSRNNFNIAKNWS